MRAISLLFSLIILCVFSVAPLAAQSVTRGLEAEVEALVEAHKLVSTVTDKASAKAVSEKLKRTFDGLRPYFGHRTIKIRLTTSWLLMSTSLILSLLACRRYGLSSATLSHDVRSRG